MSERDDLTEQAYHQPPLEMFDAPERMDYTALRAWEAGSGLDFLLELQRDVESAWGRLPDPENPEQVSTYIREVVLCATDELHEVLAEVHWKPWKEARGIKRRDAYREEMADVLHFILDLYLAAGLTGRDIVQDYVLKNTENMARTKSQEYRGS